MGWSSLCFGPIGIIRWFGSCWHCSPAVIWKSSSNHSARMYRRSWPCLPSLVSLTRRHPGRSLLRSTIGLAPLQGLDELLPGHHEDRLRDRDNDLVVFKHDVHLRRSAAHTSDRSDHHRGCPASSIPHTSGMSPPVFVCV